MGDESKVLKWVRIGGDSSITGGIRLSINKRHKEISLYTYREY